MASSAGGSPAPAPAPGPELEPAPAPAPAPTAPDEMEISLTLRRLKNGKAPGPNVLQVLVVDAKGIHKEHLKNCGPEMVKALQAVLAAAWDEGLPAGCKRSDLNTIPKYNSPAPPTSAASRSLTSSRSSRPRRSAAG